MKDLNGKSVAELEKMLSEVRADDAATVEEIGAAMSEHDLSAKAIDRNVRLQAKSHLLWVRMTTIERALKAARLRELEAEAAALRVAIPKLQQEHAAAIEATFSKAYDVLKFREQAAHEWHERRKHELRLMSKDAAEPVRIAGVIQDATVRLEQLSAAIAKANKAGAAS